jgi:hypothetical protein
MLPELYLVACVSVKLPHAAPARELYCSTWFKFARVVAERRPWAILSARHGFVMPDTILEPYEETLARKTAAERRAWAARVLPTIPAAERTVLIAGELYAEHLAGPLHAERPLAGLGIGQQLAELKRLAMTT